jgi:predicted NodU family carbamoyl transferase
MSIGGLWNRLAQDIELGYLGAGKVMGLAGYGKYNSVIDQIINEYLDSSNHKLTETQKSLIKKCSKEDVAFTLQYNTIQLIKKYVLPLKTCENICIAGGVAYNGYMNEEFTKHYDNVYVPPAVGDEGQALGTYMHAGYILNKEVYKPKVYEGGEY